MAKQRLNIFSQKILSSYESLLFLFPELLQYVTLYKNPCRNHLKEDNEKCDTTVVYDLTLLLKLDINYLFEYKELLLRNQEESSSTKDEKNLNKIQRGDPWKSV